MILTIMMLMAMMVTMSIAMATMGMRVGRAEAGRMVLGLLWGFIRRSGHDPSSTWAMRGLQTRNRAHPLSSPIKLGGTGQNGGGKKTWSRLEGTCFNLV